MPEINENVVYGRNAVTELLRSGTAVDKLSVRKGEWDSALSEIVALARECGVPVTQVTTDTLTRICGKSSHQGIVAYAAAWEYCELSDILAVGGNEPLILVAEGVQDPQNLGALLRCADAAGVHGVIISKHGGVGVTATVAKASAGAAAHMPVARVSSIPNAIEQMKHAGLWIYGAESGGQPYHKVQMTGPAAIVVGSEGKGLSRLARERCDFIVTIPMHGKINSLNVSCAAAVLLCETAKQRELRKINE